MKCTHKQIELKETIEVTTSNTIECGELISNKEVGNIVKSEFHCVDCDKTWNAYKKLPKFLSELLSEINHIRA